jgi:TP901 family phage tail tape measure protein
MAQKAAASYSMDHAVSQTEVLKSLYLGKSAGFDMATSIASMNSASALAIGLGGDMEATQRTLNLAYLNFRDPLKTADQNFKSLSDTMAKATSAFDYKNIEELRSQMELATPTALAAGMGSPEGMKDMIATLADFTRHGLTGSVAGAAFEESLHGVLKMSKNLGIQLVTNKDGGLDYMKSLEQIRTHFISLYGSMSAIPTGTLLEIQKTFGIRGMRALLLDPAEMENMRGQLDHVNGAAAQFQKTMESSPAAQWEIFKNKLEALSITVGGALLPSAISLIGVLGSVVERIVKFAQAHPALVKFVAVFAAISAGVLVAVGSLLVLAGAVASGIAAFGALGIGGPIIAGIVAVGLAIAGVVAVVAAWFPQLFDAGLNIVKMIAKGILAGVSHAISAISTVAKAIRDHLPFSPAKIGPLRDLGHIRVSETIAAAIRPAPVMRAMSSVAAGIAMTGAMMGTPAFAATAGAPNITINAPVTVKGDIYDRDGFAQALDAHNRKIVDVVEKELNRRARTDF